MSETLKLGDPVLFYGRTLHVTDFEDHDGRQIAVVWDTDGKAAREAAREELQAVREQMAAAEPTPDERRRLAEAKATIDELTPWESGIRLTDADLELLEKAEAEHLEITRAIVNRQLPPAERFALESRVAEIDERARTAAFGFKLRADLLSWWPEREVWVSDGRILTDDQKGRFKKLTGNRVKPDQERDALDMLAPLPEQKG